ncbi:hypothetical protein AVEN_237501-1 [Araneus ventricosus]|uniref:CCHC-type domain-containing protein n=1 Tax=Araneus ventricosus TaxID=182803 RepID=A0A4Y2PUT2_ARAVE|nr:hypothetical protein AVEN_237501-1 [Araneus ventricosus]
MATSKDSKIKALKSESLLGMATTGVKSKTGKSKAMGKKLPSGSDDDFKEGYGLPKPKFLGKQNKIKTPSVPGPVVAPFQFRQTNPFGLQPVGAAPLESVKANTGSTLPSGYVGFGLSMGLPAGTRWGNTPYPGAVQEDVLAGADRTNVLNKENTSVAPPSVLSVEGGGVTPADRDGYTDTPDPSVTAGTPQLKQGGLFTASHIAEPQVLETVLPALPPGDAMEEDGKSGQKRKPTKVPKRKLKVSKGKSEGSIDSLLMDNSSSDSDKTVIVPKSLGSLPSDEEQQPLEIPPTPNPRLEELYPDSVFFKDDQYSYEQSGICPWLWYMSEEFRQTYHEPIDRLKNINEFLSTVSDYFMSHQTDWKKMAAAKVQLEAEKAQLEVKMAQMEVQMAQFEEQLRAGVMVPTPLPLPGRSAWSKVVKRHPLKGGPSTSVVQQEVPTVVGDSIPVRVNSPLVSTRPSVQQPHVQQTPLVPFAAKVKLKPPQGLPTVLVKPLGDTIDSSAGLNRLLETHVHPKILGIQIVACLPAAGNGVIVRTESIAMANILENDINAHPDLNGVYTAEEPKKPNPRILVYDVPELPGYRVEQENLFLAKLGQSNSFPEGAATVHFRRKGRGYSQHWVISLDPIAFHSLGTSILFHWGFGSFKFRPFYEPQQCFKCSKFGHTQSSCHAKTELCSRCPGEHSYRNCREQQPSCRNCIEFNRRTRARPSLSVNHTAVSRHCPMFLRECEELRGRFSTVFKKI